MMTDVPTLLELMADRPEPDEDAAYELQRELELQEEQAEEELRRAA